MKTKTNTKTTKRNANTITEFTAANCRTLDAKLKALLHTFAEEHGLTVTSGGGKYTYKSFSPKFEFACASTGNVEDVEREAFVDACHCVGLKPEHYGAKFTVGGHTFKITTIKLRQRSRPIIATGMHNGLLYKFTEDAVQRALGIENRQSFLSAPTVTKRGRR